MNIGESLLVIGALVTFTLAALHLNGTKLDTGNKIMQSEFRTTAIGVAQQVIEHAQELKFDEVLTDTSFSGPYPGGFTNVNDLGPETGESAANPDDIDDLNGYSTSVITGRNDYSVNCSVSYADTADVSSGFGSKSLLKIMTVKVSSMFFEDTVQLQYVYRFQ